MWKSTRLDDDQLLTGKTINGYVVGERFGRGGMGEVYRVNLPDDDPVAMKIIRQEITDPNVKERFRREIRLMQRLHHEHLVPILDHGESGNLIYLIMPIISGPTLKQLLEIREFSPQSSLEILLPVARVLEFMHHTGAMHRDIKPANIFLEFTPAGWHPYIADLGLAKNPRFDTDLPALERFEGTIEYAAPDLKKWEDIDHQTDIYGLAVIAYEMLLGVIPFNVHNAGEFLPEPRTLQPEFPQNVQRVLMRGLQPEKEKRFKTVKGFIYDYEAAVMNLPHDERLRSYWLKHHKPTTREV